VCPSDADMSCTVLNKDLPLSAIYEAEVDADFVREMSERHSALEHAEPTIASDHSTAVATDLGVSQRSHVEHDLAQETSAPATDNESVEHRRRHLAHHRRGH
jgi:hypothetical protein